jgi:hypothetical protein
LFPRKRRDFVEKTKETQKKHRYYEYEPKDWRTRATKTKELKPSFVSYEDDIEAGRIAHHEDDQENSPF